MTIGIMGPPLNMSKGHLKLSSFEISITVTDLDIPEQPDADFVSLNCQLHIIAEFDADFDAMNDKTQSQKGERDASQNHQALNIGIDFQRRNIKEGDHVIDEMQLLQQQP